jgi:hypothetical protein
MTNAAKAKYAGHTVTTTGHSFGHTRTRHKRYTSASYI